MLNGKWRKRCEGKGGKDWQASILDCLVAMATIDEQTPHAQRMARAYVHAHTRTHTHTPMCPYGVCAQTRKCHAFRVGINYQTPSDSGPAWIARRATIHSKGVNCVCYFPVVPAVGGRGKSA